MDFMFVNAKSFAVQLCGEAWINSNASQSRMFEGADQLLPTQPPLQPKLLPMRVLPPPPRPDLGALPPPPPPDLKPLRPPPPPRRGVGVPPRYSFRGGPAHLQNVARSAQFGGHKGRILAISNEQSAPKKPSAPMKHVPSKKRTACSSIFAHAVTKIRMFKPRSHVELKSALEACLEVEPKGRCTEGPNGPIRRWDVSRVTYDML